ncbi:hypothetical protein [Acuticoccus mangrovi]|uniref:Uncharacterized protein n=1 Tax=Acuticoccus mangrovi TaxID=2796142 RepID=A0A934MDB8_9HYPH|nr:hypothetical protein [Acuticoccus mangrovi]MBJ3776172.1 hypothetical protein [Acuticoccus mangrovi]
MTDIEPESELDPAMERVRKKLTRLLLVSSAIMGLGFVTVGIAVVYRVSRDTASVPEPAAPVALPIEPGELVAATVSGERLVLTVGGDNPRIEVRRLGDGALTDTFMLARPATPEPPR